MNGTLEYPYCHLFTINNLTWQVPEEDDQYPDPGLDDIEN
jgi:hypothetical protein